jgi:hypothetical protein
LPTSLFCKLQKTPDDRSGTTTRCFSQRDLSGNFMKALFKYLDEIPETVIFLASVTLVILLGIIDYLTGYELAFSIFYLQPVSLVSWFGKKSYAVIICILSAIAWLLADIYAGDTYSNSFIPVWNASIRLGFFLITVFSLMEIKRLLNTEQTLFYFWKRMRLMPNQ